MDALLNAIAYYVQQVIATIGDAAFKLYNTLGAWLNNFITSITNSFQAAINELRIAFTALRDTISSVLSSMLTQLSAMLNSVLTTLTNVLTTVANKIESALSSIVTSIGNAMSKFIDSAKAAFDKMWSAIESTATGILNKISSFVSTIAAELQVKLGQIVDTVKGWINTAIAYITDIVASGLKAVQDFYAYAASKVNALFESAMGALSGFVRRVVESIDAVFDLAFGAIGTFIESIGEKLGDIRQGFADAVDKLITNVVGIPKELAAEFAVKLADLLDPILETTPKPEMIKGTQIIKGFLTGGVGINGYRDNIAALFEQLNGLPSIVRSIGLIFIALLGLIPTSMSIGSAYGEVIKQELATQLPYALLSPADVTAAYRRGFIDQTLAINIIRRQGFNAEDANVILRLSENVPAEGDMLAMWKRGIVSDEALDDGMRQRGYTPDWTGRMKQAASIIPPPSDLILMAVREAWDPAAIQNSGLNVGFPQEFAEWAERQGLSRDWAMKYWTSHWSLPSPSQGYEMLHRGVIDMARLRALLKALDIAPGWQDEMIKIAYNPYTRVDIRRMHQLGVLSDDDVLKAYKDLGYDDEHAARLQQFTLKLNKHAPSDDDEELGKLSRDAILGFFEDGLLDRGRATTLLASLGVTPEAADLYITAREMDVERKRRRLERDTILDQADVGILTFDGAQDALSALGLTDVEISDALTELTKRAVKKVKLPTRAEGERFFRKSIITEEQYSDLLTRLGYSETWVRAFVKDAKES